MTISVFIDGEAGTTGLEIRDRLKNHKDVTLLSIDAHRRKDTGARRDLLNSADCVILCLPDEAAVEAVALIDSAHVRIIDASTAYRTHKAWVYGFAEMAPGQRERIKSAKHVTNPGCYPTGAVALIRPLIDAGVLPRTTPISINAVSGYSGGGKAMIARYEDESAQNYDPKPFRLYGLSLAHKHVPEIKLHGGLDYSPLFVPAVAPLKQGMIVEVPLHLWSLPEKPKAKAVHHVLHMHYESAKFVTVVPFEESTQEADLYADEVNETNALKLRVFADRSGDMALLTATLDNLGKGASGAAVQNLNIMFGFDEGEGL